MTFGKSTFGKFSGVIREPATGFCFLTAVTLVMTLALPMTAAFGEDDYFPHAYGILAKEKYVFPVDLGDWPLKIDSRRQLFVDDFVVKTIANLEREFHQLKKHIQKYIHLILHKLKKFL